MKRINLAFKKGGKLMVILGVLLIMVGTLILVFQANGNGGNK